MQQKTAAIIGHHPKAQRMNGNAFTDLQLDLWTALSALIDRGYETFYCDAGRGVGIMCGEIILAEKATRHPGLQLICVVPQSGHTAGWTQSWRMHCELLLAEAGRVVRTAPGEDPHRYMVDHADLLAVLHGDPPHEAVLAAAEYARQQEKEVVLLHTDLA